MKVKEVAEFLKVSTDEILKLLKNVSVGKSYTEDSEIEKELEKKLAKRYGVPYPFKAKSKAEPAKATPKAEPAKAAPKPKPEKAEPVKEVKEKPAKEQVSNNKPKAKQEPAKVGNNKGKQEPAKVGNNNKGKQEPAKSGNNNKGKQEPKQAAPKPVSKPRPADIPSYKDEIVETVVDEEFLDKYDEFLQDNQYQNGQNTKIKQKVRTNEKVNKKPKQQKSRAEKLAGSIEQKKEDHVLYYELNMTVMDVADALSINVTDLVKKLFTSMGIFASATQTLDRDTIELIAMEYDYEVKDKQITDLIRFDEIQIEDNESELEPRPAIVTIMGHVDHGKTT